VAEQTSAGSLRRFALSVAILSQANDAIAFGFVFGTPFAFELVELQVVTDSNRFIA
jgi:hypothetical protein